jgi:hypothetical protein
MQPLIHPPAISTFIEATARGYLDCLPHLTVRKIRRNKPHTVATSLGHLDQTRKNYKSTKSTFAAVPPLRPTPHIDDELDTLPPHEPVSTNFIYKKEERTHQNFMDSTGRFPVKSRVGNEYNLIMYNHKANYIHVEPMKRRTGRLVDAYRRGHAFFKSKGFHPKFERLDNEPPNELQDYMMSENISNVAMRPKEPYVHSKTISSPLYARWIKTSRYNYGMQSYRKRR